MQAEVLYLALEDGPQRLHSRALRLAGTAPSGLHLCHRAAPIGQGLEQQIEVQLAEHPHIRLVVLDTLQKVRCVGGSGMSYGSDYEDAEALKALADRNGFPKDYHLHTMRHFFATYLLENGTSKQVTADLLGHADTAFLERTYCHPQDTCKEQAAGLLDTMLQPADAAAWERAQRLLAAGNP